MPRTDDTAQIMETDAPAPSPRTAAPGLHPRRLLTVVFITALLLLMAMAVLSYVSVLQSADHTHWLDHTYEVIIAADKLRLDEQDTAASERGYLLTGKPAFLDQYVLSRSRVGPDLDDLERLTVDNPVQQQRIAGLRALNRDYIARLDQVIARAGGQPRLPAAAAARELEANKAAMETLRSITNDLIAEEHGLLGVRYAETERSRHIVQLVIIAGNLLSLGVLAICFMLLTREIRTRREAEAAVQGLNDELSERAGLLELANKELEGFSYSISHDLRSPLRAIDGFTQLLERSYDTVLDAEGMRLLGVVRINAKRMGALIEDLLAFSRLGRKSVEMRPLDMRQLVREALNEVLPDAERVPELVIGELPSCLGDRALIKQVWVNLASNAVKYSSKVEHPRIEIEGHEQGGHVVYTVKDNGVGFDMQYYGKLFGVFQRLHGVDEFSGTGVGLAIVMRVVTKHGGHAWAESALGEGAAFHFSLPPRGEAHE